MSAISDRDWFMNGYTLALAGIVPHEKSPESMWDGWSWGALERHRVFEQKLSTKGLFRRMWRDTVSKIQGFRL